MKTLKNTKGTSFLMEGKLFNSLVEPELSAEEIREKEMAKRFDDIMHQIRKGGHAQEIMDLPIELLCVDTAYQIPERTNRNLDKLIAKWDMNKLMPILVVPHEEEKRFAIVDGTGCVAASQKIATPLDYIRSMITMTAPTEIEARRKFEAELYAFQTEGTTPLRPSHKHGARLILGDKGAIAIDKMQKKYEISFVYTKGQRKPKTIGSYSKLYNIAKYQGEEALDWIFSLLNAAGFDRKDNGYSDAMLRATRDLWIYYPEKRAEVFELATEFLRPITQNYFKSLGVAKYPILDYKMGMSLYLEDVVTSKLGITKRRYINEKGKIATVENLEGE